MTRSATRLGRGLAQLGPVLALVGCSPAGLLNGLDRVTPGGGTKLAVRGAAYGTAPRQRLDVWVPRDGAARHPVVVFFYGGGWVAGRRQDYGFAGRALAARGFVVVVPDYRLVPTARFPTFVEDGALAVRWARDHAADYGGDPRRLSLAGHSAGAYIAALLALDRHYLADAGLPAGTVRAAALLAGPYDFYPFTEQRGRDALGAWPRPAETQPITFARAGAPPLLLMHGTADTVVQPRNSEALAARLRALGAPVTLRLYPRKSHVDLVKALSRPFRGDVPTLDDSATFLTEHSR